VWFLLDRNPIVFGPFFYHFDHILHLRIGGVPQDRHNIGKRLTILATRDDRLKDPDAGAALPLPIFRIGIQPFQHVEGLGGVVELAHLVGVVGNELEKGEGLPARLHLEVELPGQPGLAVHDVAAGQPGQVSVVLGRNAVIKSNKKRKKKLMA
jgi:hypothetical protein